MNCSDQAKPAGTDFNFHSKATRIRTISEQPDLELVVCVSAVILNVAECTVGESGNNVRVTIEIKVSERQRVKRPSDIVETERLALNSRNQPGRDFARY